MKAKLTMAEDEIVAAEGRVNDLGDIEHLEARNREFQEKLSEGRRKLSKLNVR
jgi:hypothetical protein